MKVIKCIFLVFLLVFSIWYHIASCKRWCYHYVDDLAYGSISDLDEYVKYSMLSSKIKKYIKKDDLKFTTDEEVFSLAQKLQKIDYEDITDSKSTWSTYDFRYSDLNRWWMNIDDKFYYVSFSLTFAPNYFSFISSEPKIIRFKATIREMELPD
ncbi:MAG: hypothetical protein NC320_03690 [Clostridium sp.]|nr:hypothetical protein [Clostridium sp.]